LLIQPLRPFVAGIGKGSVLTLLPAPDGFQLGVAIPGHGDLRGGFLSAADLLELGRSLVKAAADRMAEDWHNHRPYVKAAGRG
jgi:hypothetical protein